MCGDMVDGYKVPGYRFDCSQPLVGRYITVQVSVNSEPDLTFDPTLAFHVNEIQVFGQGK